MEVSRKNLMLKFMLVTKWSSIALLKLCTHVCFVICDRWLLHWKWVSNVLTTHKESSARAKEGAVAYHGVNLMWSLSCALKSWEIVVKSLWFSCRNCRARGILVGQGDFYQAALAWSCLVLPKPLKYTEWNSSRGWELNFLCSAHLWWILPAVSNPGIHACLGHCYHRTGNFFSW